MARKDSEKDTDRPHYYSQFWLDVAAGRRIIGTPRTDESDSDEDLEPVAPHRPARPTAVDDERYHETVVHPQVEPELEEDADEFSIPELDLDTPDITEEIDEEEIPTFGANEDDIPDVEIVPPIEEAEEIEEPENEEEGFFDEEEDEDEDDSWTARGRKKPKPGRQAKLPSKTPTKRVKREPRRGF